MEFFKNFYKDDDKIIGLCAFKKQRYRSDLGFSFEPKFGATKLLYEPKFKPNMFMV
jgi:hypothetical protein